MKRLILILFAGIFATGLIAQENIAVLGGLPDAVRETSGLLFYKGRLITHNDSGNAAELYEIDTLSLEITRTITISNATNIDWEDLAQDENYLYIGDIGNTLGNREDLVIYRILKVDYDTSDSVTAEGIYYSYEDQADFSGDQNSDWDAEAMVVFQDQLLIFTKEWQQNETRAYMLPTTPGEYLAIKKGQYSVNGLITGATFNTYSNILYLIGYSQLLQPFTVRIADINLDEIFNDSTQRSSLSIGLGQTEAITYTTENRYYISSEYFSSNTPAITLQATLFLLVTNDSMVEEDPRPPDNPDEDPKEPEKDNQELVIYRAPGSRLLEYELTTDSAIFGRAIFDTLGRRIRYTNANSIEDNTIDLSELHSAQYYLTFYLQGKTIAQPFVLY